MNVELSEETAEEETAGYEEETAYAETEKKISASEERMKKGIEDGIKNDGIPEEMINEYLNSRLLTKIFLRFKMLAMLHAAEPSYAEIYFELLTDIEKKCNKGELKNAEAGDLAQNYLNTVKSLSDCGVPTEKLSEFLLRSVEETGEYPKPYALFTLKQQEKERKALQLAEAEKEQAQTSAALKKLQEETEELKKELEQENICVGKDKKEEEKLLCEVLNLFGAQQKQKENQKRGKEQ